MNTTLPDLTKHRLILNQMRDQILSGQLKPGERLPTRRQIEQTFAAGPVTVQRALDRLARDGFVVAQGRRGTFVAPRPPHLSQYALVFPSPTAGTSLFYGALVQAAAGVQQDQPGIRVSNFFGVDGHTDSEDFQRLVADVKNHRLAGIIFATRPLGLDQTPLLAEPGLPRIAIMSSDHDTTLPAVAVDMEAFFDRAAADLAKRGRKRPALLTCCDPSESAGRGMEDGFRRHATKHRLDVGPQRIQFVHSMAAWTCSRLVETLLAFPASERMDSLIICDDNLVEPATRALAASPTGREIDIVAHCNFPTPPRTSMPVRFLGFDARQLIDICMNHVIAQRDGSTPPPVTDVPPRFEDETTGKPVVADSPQKNMEFAGSGT